MVFSGLYPTNNNDFENLRESLAKLRLNDSSFVYAPENSEGLGFGFRCGFLGMLHREIIQQRLERDCDLDLIQTAPNVTYEILNRKGETLVIDNPQKIPDAGQIEEFREPFARISFLLPAENIGAIMTLCHERRGVYITPFVAPQLPQEETAPHRLIYSIAGVGAPFMLWAIFVGGAVFVRRRML